MEGDFTRRSGRLAAKLHPCPSVAGPDLDNSPPLHIGPQHIIGTHHRWAPYHYHKVEQYSFSVRLQVQPCPFTLD